MLAALALLFAQVDDTPKTPSPAFDSVIFLFAPIVLFVIFIVLPMRRDARARRELLTTLKKNDRVLLNGFLIGTVVQIMKAEKQPGEDELLVKIDDNANIRMRVLRGAVTRIFPSDEPAKESKEGT